jgi:hypothetical protein
MFSSASKIKTWEVFDAAIAASNSKSLARAAAGDVAALAVIVLNRNFARQPCCNVTRQNKS